ncbi:LxmA leader domain family RiPP [Streptomyces sp. NPDC048566]|uniref:LxmA leader domain family RiPP n=1 Tax=Streptomyces sp. NPDC048566 TaxID=3365569 RepID=UPI003716E2C8
MSVQDLMNGFDAYTDAGELAAQAAVGVADEQSTPTITITIGVSLSLTAEHTC